MRSTPARVTRVVLIALAVWKLPGGGVGATAVLELLAAATVGAVIWSIWNIGRERRFELERLDDGQRAILYGSIAMLALALAGRGELWATTVGSVVWILMAAAAAAGGFLSWRAWREL